MTKNTASGLYNKVPLWHHFISTPLFLSQTPRVCYKKAVSLAFLILDSHNV